MDGTITLHDESGFPVQFDFLDLFQYEGKEYVVLLPTENAGDPPEVVILQVEETGNEESYTGIEDETLLEKLFSEFQCRNKNRFNFVE